MRYLLGGYYGMRNVGDDVLLYVTIAEMARVDGDAAFTVVSEIPEAVPPGTRVHLTPGGRRLENLRQMLRHDVWLFGGGGLLQDGSPRAVDYLQRLGRAAQIVTWLGRRIALAGIGIGPLHSAGGRAAAARILRLADLVTVRDDESRALAAEIAPEVAVHVTGDLAFLLPRHLPPAPPRVAGSRTLGVSLLPFARSVGGDARADDQGVQAMADALRAVLDRHRDWRVHLFEFFSGSEHYGDALVLRTLERRLGLGDRVVYRPYTGDFAAVWSDIAACDAFVGMRFHSCVLAHLAQVPCLMIAYHPKSENLARRLRVGAEAVLPLPLLQDGAGVAARLEILMAEPDKFRPQGSLEELATASGTTFRLMADWPAQPSSRGISRRIR